MENKILLNFPNNMIALADNTYGKIIYDIQVKGKLDISKDFYIEIPSNITIVASSFISGFFHDIINEIGLSKTEERLHIISENTELCNKIKKYLILVD